MFRVENKHKDPLDTSIVVKDKKFTIYIKNLTNPDMIINVIFS